MNGLTTRASGRTAARPDQVTTGAVVGGVATGLVATGTSRANALALTRSINRIATAAASSGVVLAPMRTGETQTVFNDGANAVKVYAPGSTTIDGTAGATGVTLSAGNRAVFVAMSGTAFQSALLGAVSA